LFGGVTAVDIYERVVQIYVNEIEQHATITQPWITFDKSGAPCKPFPPQTHSWAYSPDFIIICMEEKQIQVAEVSASGYWDRGPKKKVDEFLAHRETIERYVRELLRMPTEFVICLRLFIKKDLEGKLRKYFKRIGAIPAPEITTLEDVFEHLAQGAMPWLRGK
jgi:hypothetical protein